MVRKRWGANLFTWNWRLSAVDPIHACSKTMQNSEPAYVHCPTCRPADLPTWIPFPRSSKILPHLSLRIQKNTIAHRSKKNWIKPSQLTQALTLGFKSQHNINIIKISSLFNHSSPPSRVLSLSVWTFLTHSILGHLTPQLSPPLTWMLPWKAQEFEGF